MCPVSKSAYKLLLSGLFIFIFSFFFSCSTQNEDFRTHYSNYNTLLHRATDSTKGRAFLKAHAKNGDVLILTDRWIIDTSSRRLTGYGSRYDYNRVLQHNGGISISTDSIALFETNVDYLASSKSRQDGVYFFGFLNGAILGLCIINPKMCYGSCPTFYVNDTTNVHYSDAEGFSSAILPSTEYEDIDALPSANVKNGNFSLIMKNEAWETHYINDIKLLVCPKQKNERILQSVTDEFYRCTSEFTPVSARAPEGSIIDKINTSDKNERFSYASDKNLSEKEEIILHFNVTDDSSNYGLVLDFRQTLLTTYCIYNAMAYMGDEYSDFFAGMEQKKGVLPAIKDGILKELGGIAVYILDKSSNKWLYQGEFNEVGPIAINRQILPLQNTGKEVVVKLIATKGLWRVDYASLFTIKEKVNPLSIHPYNIINNNKIDNSLISVLLDTNKHIMTLPGDSFRFDFSLPDRNTDYAVFLSSTGFYLEWMRSEWLKDKDFSKLHQLVYYPKKFLREEAPLYKKQEKILEREFWNSRANLKYISYENNN